MNQNINQDILSRYKSGNVTAEEKKLVDDWILHGKDFQMDLSEVELLEDLIDLRARIQQGPKTRSKKLWPKVAIAASILLVSTIGLVTYFKNTAVQHQIAISLPQPDKLPGTNVATLTLSNGSRLKLVPSEKSIHKDLGVQIRNDADGNLVYLAGVTAELSNPSAHNTITTPRGGTYKVLLPDGSKVWLNAASSLKFPLKFSDTERVVELTGEGFFEVAKTNKKFKVITNGTTVEVLGTHFNVNAYQNEHSCKVTLTEGSVKLWKAQRSILLKPGEQGETNSANNLISVKQQVDVEAISAWKDGTFKFNNTDLKNIMRQLERWYDVDVDENLVPNKKFNGTISREVKLSEVLSMIEVTSDLHFKLEGRRIIMN